MPRNVALPDGTIVEGVPDDVTDAQVLQKVKGSDLKSGLAGIADPAMDFGKGLFTGGVDSISGVTTQMIKENESDIIPGQRKGTFAAMPAMSAFRNIYDSVSKLAGTKTMNEVAEAGREANKEFQEENKPAGEAGKWGRSIGKEGSLAFLGPGTLPVKLASAVGGGVGAETGKRFGGDLGEFAGSVLGGGITGLTMDKLAPPNATSILRGAVEHLTPTDFVKARALSNVLKEEGIKHTSAQLFDKSTILPDIFNETMRHHQVAPKIHEQFTDVPDSVRYAVGMKLATQFGQPGTAKEAFRGIQESTANAIDANSAAGNAQYGKALANALQGAAKAPKFDVVDLADEFQRRAESFAVGSPRAAFYQKARRMLYGQDVPTTADMKVDAQMRGWPADATFWPDNAVRDKRILSSINADLNVLIKETGIDPKDFEVLRVKKDIAKLVPEMVPVNRRNQQFIEGEQAPMERSLTGRVAKFGGGPKEWKDTAREGILNEIFPNTNQAEEIVGMGRDLTKYAGRPGTAPIEADRARNALGGALREEMERKLNAVDKDVKGMPNTNIAGDFVQQLYASPAQKANVLAAVTEASRAQGRDPAAVARGFDNLMNAFNTFNKVNLKPGIDPYEINQKAGASLPAAGVAPFSEGSKTLRAASRTKSAKEFARVLSNPSGLDELEMLARLGPEATYAMIFGGAVARASGRMTAVGED